MYPYAHVVVTQTVKDNSKFLECHDGHARKGHSHVVGANVLDHFFVGVSSACVKWCLDICGLCLARVCVTASTKCWPLPTRIELVTIGCRVTTKVQRSPRLSYGSTLVHVGRASCLVKASCCRVPHTPRCTPCTSCKWLRCSRPPPCTNCSARSGGGWSCWRPWRPCW